MALQRARAVFSFSLIGLCLFLGGTLHGQSGKLRPTHLETGTRDNPVGIGAQGLVFSWNLASVSAKERGLKQTAYQVRVASSAAKLVQGRGDIWDSGRMLSASFWQLPYGGPALKSHTIYYWQARSWDGEGYVGAWSRPAHFTTALLPSDWSAHWIGSTAEKAKSALPVFRHDFKLRGPVARALLFVSGMGQYEIHLNGRNVTGTVMNPGWTDYRKTIDYDTYDVGRLLRPGTNAFGVLLGNGMYNVEETEGRYTKFANSFGQPKCIVQMELTYRDGSSERIVSDGSWLTHPGPITFSSIYGGEDFDGRALPQGWDLPGYRGADWQPAAEVAGPGGQLTPGESAPLTIAQVYKPVAVTHPKPGVTVYDLGETMSGWPAVRVQGAGGSRVTLLPGELLAADGTVSQRSTNASPADPVLYKYTLRGGPPESWHPRFSYHSFRYVQVGLEASASGGRGPEILSVSGNFVHARVPVIGTFSSSNELFNRIHRLIDRAVLSNLASVVTDCPSREKLGWLEQTYLNASTLMLNYDVRGLYAKMARDIADAQLPDGLVPSIAPEYVAFVDSHGKSNDFRDSPEWGSAIILSSWAVYQYTGNAAPLLQSYAGMQRYLAYLEERSEGGLLNHGLGDWYDIGPEPPGPSQLTSRSVTATGVFYEDLVAMARIASLLGYAEDAARYTQQAANVRESYNATLFHPETGQYDRGSQTADALPLALGLVPAHNVQEVLDHLIANIHEHRDHVTAGDVGFHYVVRALTDYGRSDVLAQMLSRTDSPSYGYQLQRGATTLTEAWDTNTDSSQNHFMLGHGEEWFYRGLAGLSIDLSRPAAQAITLHPNFVDGIASAQASYQSPMGLVRIAWHRARGGVSLDLSIPPGAQAYLLLPLASDWREGQRSAAGAPGVSNVSQDWNTVSMELGSGLYHLSTTTLKHLPTARR